MKVEVEGKGGGVEVKVVEEGGRCRLPCREDVVEICKA